MFQHFNLWQRIDKYPYPEEEEEETTDSGDDGTTDDTDTGEETGGGGETDDDDIEKDFIGPIDPTGSVIKSDSENVVGLVYDNITMPTINNIEYIPYDNPTRDHAFINLFSREHDSELCMRDID